MVIYKGFISNRHKCKVIVINGNTCSAVYTYKMKYLNGRLNSFYDRPVKVSIKEYLQ